jgi:hypothetical protein
VAFTPSTAAPTAQGGTGPTWWDRITTNFRDGIGTQSTNLATKPPEKFQIGLRSMIVKPQKTDQAKTDSKTNNVNPFSGSLFTP